MSLQQIIDNGNMWDIEDAMWDKYQELLERVMTVVYPIDEPATPDGKAMLAKMERDFCVATSQYRASVYVQFNALTLFAEMHGIPLYAPVTPEPKIECWKCKGLGKIVRYDGYDASDGTFIATDSEVVRCPVCGG